MGIPRVLGSGPEEATGTGATHLSLYAQPKRHCENKPKEREKGKERL